MSHHHHDHDHSHQDHDHDHSHDHNHEHDHGHGHTTAKELSFDEKLTILLQHWIDHNRSHQETYDSWANKATDEKQPQTAEILKEISADSNKITEKLEKALGLIKG
jgi:ABC-type Zn2+ transport system substrate-binding protein/surface adhesin